MDRVVRNKGLAGTRSLIHNMMGLVLTRLKIERELRPGSMKDWVDIGSRIRVKNIGLGQI